MGRTSDGDQEGDTKRKGGAISVRDSEALWRDSGDYDGHQRVGDGEETRESGRGSWNIDEENEGKGSILV